MCASPKKKKYEQKKLLPLKNFIDWGTFEQTRNERAHSVKQRVRVKIGASINK